MKTHLILYNPKPNHISMKKLLFSFLLISASICNATSLNAQVIHVQYKQTIAIPENVKQMTDISMRDYIIAEIQKQQAVFNLVTNKGIYGFSANDLKDETYKIDGSGSVYMDMNTNEKYSIKTIIDKPFLVTETLKTLEWNTTDETKEILGYQCHKATYGDTVAWFCAELPIPFGPSGTFGLPGLILELQTNTDSYTAISISTENNNIDIVLNLDKSKAITRKEYAKIQKKKLKEFGVDSNGPGKGKPQVKVITM